MARVVPLAPAVPVDHAGKDNNKNALGISYMYM